MVLDKADDYDAHILEHARRYYPSLDAYFSVFGKGGFEIRNKKIMEMVKAENPETVFEFASAFGFLALTILNGVPLKKYTCTNYSKVSLYCMEKQLRGIDNCEILKVNADIGQSDDMKKIKFKDYDVIITTSFEHIEHDIELIKLLPKGSVFIFCVPNISAPDHFRYFNTEQEIRSRYSDSLEIKELVELPTDVAKFFIVKGLVK